VLLEQLKRNARNFKINLFPAAACAAAVIDSLFAGRGRIKAGAERVLSSGMSVVAGARSMCIIGAVESVNK